MKVKLCLVLVECSVCLLVTSFHCANAGRPKVVLCDGETINLCEKYIKSWKVSDISGKEIRLLDCVRGDVRRGNRLLLFVSQGYLTNYGKYKVVIVRRILSEFEGGCRIQLTKPTSLSLVMDNSTTLIAQKLPYFRKIVLSNQCVLTCDEQKDGLGGILAFRSRSLEIDDSSKIEMSGKGFRGGKGGDPRGGGGYGGEIFSCPVGCKMGKGGDVFGEEWSENSNGIGGGGGGDGPNSRQGSKGGPGGPNAGGGGGDSTQNADDGAGAGGGGGHFSGGGGGGGGSGCGTDGGTGGTAGNLGEFAGGGGQSTCPGGKGGDGGQAGEWTGNRAPLCYDPMATGGNAGSPVLGGGGGDSCGGHFGGGGGGGGLQFGNIDFRRRLSYGGGGGGGGASAHANDPNPGGRGGNGGGLVFLLLHTLTLDGEINANGEPGECLSHLRHRSAPGGSGAGGSVVIKAKKLKGDPRGKISVSGAGPVKCGFGAGGGGGGGVGRWVVKAGRVVQNG